MENIPYAPPLVLESPDKLPVARLAFQKGTLVKLTKRGCLFERIDGLGGPNREDTYYTNLVGLVYWINKVNIAVWWSVFNPVFNDSISGCKGETVHLSYTVQDAYQIMYGMESNQDGTEINTGEIQTLFPSKPGKGVVVDEEGRMMWKDYYGPK